MPKKFESEFLIAEVRMNVSKNSKAAKASTATFFIYN